MVACRPKRGENGGEYCCEYGGDLAECRDDEPASSLPSVPSSDDDLPLLAFCFICIWLYTAKRKCENNTKSVVVLAIPSSVWEYCRVGLRSGKNLYHNSMMMKISKTLLSGERSESMKIPSAELTNDELCVYHKYAPIMSNKRRKNLLRYRNPQPIIIIDHNFFFFFAYLISLTPIIFKPLII